MIEKQLETTVPQPQGEAFDFFIDFRNEPAWNPDCLLVEKTSNGPIGLGTTFDGKMKGVGPNKAEIVAYDRPNRCTVIERSRVGEGTFDFRFAPANGGGTRIEMTMQIKPKGPMRLLQPLMGKMLGKMVAELPDRMRRGIDAADRVRESAAGA
jgi:polyketide cyclase/dehydrase/lipid transport protein